MHWQQVHLAYVQFSAFYGDEIGYTQKYFSSLITPCADNYVLYVLY